MHIMEQYSRRTQGLPAPDPCFAVNAAQNRGTVWYFKPLNDIFLLKIMAKRAFLRDFSQ
jgi:hypothetical protein